MEKLLSSAAEFLNVKPFLLLQMISRITATATPMATSRKRKTEMIIPAMAPSLRPLLVLSVCSPCDGGSNMLAVVVESLAELSMFDGEDSLVFDDITIVEIVGRLSKIDTKISAVHGAV